jgi:hypothetical protein
MKLKRTASFILAIGALVLVGFGANSLIRRHVERKQQAVYQSILRSYSAELKPGTARRDVELLLRAKGQSFQQTCCILNEDRTALEDLVKIGSEPAPWYCSENDVYLVFEFYSPRHPGPTDAQPSDSLERVAVSPWLQGCL